MPDNFENHPVNIYSHLLLWLHALNMRTAPANQWRATILSAGGIREDEIARSALLDFLDGVDPSQKVSKKDLIEIAESNLSSCLFTISTEQTDYYSPSIKTARLTREAIPKKIQDTFSDGEVISCHKLASFNYRVLRLKFTGMLGIEESWCVFDENWQRFKPFKNYQNAVEAIDFLYSVATDRFREYSSQAPHNLFERYSLLGKNSGYKEWIICLPEWDDLFNQSHFDKKNVILHLRTSEWKDTDNRSLFLVDEMQSDWHALGRVHGYHYTDHNDGSELDAVPDVPFKKEWHELGVKLAIWVALKSGHQRIAFTTSEVHQARYGFNSDVFELLYDQLIPKTLTKLAKKFHCTLAPAAIWISKPNDSISYKRGIGWELCKRGKKEDKQIIKNQAVAMRYLEGRGNKVSQELQVFEISPELIDQVKSKGLPLFGMW